MVSVQETHPNSSRSPLQRSYCSSFAASASTRSKAQRNVGRSMRTIRSKLFQNDNACSFTSANGNSCFVSENLTDSVVDMRLGELAAKTNQSLQSCSTQEEFLELSQAFSDFSACSSDISGELQRLANLPMPESNSDAREVDAESEREPCLGFLQRENFSTEIIESISPVIYGKD